MAGVPPPPPPTPPSQSNVELLGDGTHSRASDAGSVKDSASDAGSNTTMETSVSASTLASGASTAFYSTQVHVFSLHEFAGHEIQTILEDGESHPDEAVPDEARSEVGGQSVRPGSIVSNIEQRLDDIDGLHGFEQPGESNPEAPPESDSEYHSAGSSSAHSLNSMYKGLLDKMQYRDLTPADLQLLMQLEAQSNRRAIPTPKWQSCMRPIACNEGPRHAPKPHRMQSVEALSCGGGGGGGSSVSSGDDGGGPSGYGGGGRGYNGGYGNSGYGGSQGYSGSGSYSGSSGGAGTGYSGGYGGYSNAPPAVARSLPTRAGHNPGGAGSTG
eukprot:CAMPEP_0181194198 /NCGR_PEP_ID=MMETSP1096-20121128/14212_1 /TAXON_ID=156174 ORGANISM="Chrysochromulina ericina, Strain CCMP281" /NCGR_SAMPLE_ID=MMETSP1096 /ASSEMBLY_ACC=CAM_ASM_000453 /LENGTH=327 /DNA_ID=CAMNT_0023283691 /DNA_START=3 /DNA_END=986 /DNA_ORIENTATION=-